MNRLNNAILPVLIVTTLVLVSALVVWQTKTNVSRENDTTTKSSTSANTNVSDRPFEMYIFTPGRTITVPQLGMAVSLEESSMQCPEGTNTNAANTNSAPTSNTNESSTPSCEHPQYYARFKTINLQQNTQPTNTNQPGQPTVPQPGPQQNSIVFNSVPGQQVVNGRQVQLVELTQESARVLVFSNTVAK